MFFKSQKLLVTYDCSGQFHCRRGIGLLHSDWQGAARSGQQETMPAQERWSRENPGIHRGLCCTTGEEGEKVADFPISLSHIWPT